jgi:hypothetical protein
LDNGALTLDLGQVCEVEFSDVHFTYQMRPDKPVIPLKIIVQELKYLLEREIESGRLERIEKLDEQLLTKYVN